MAQPDASALQRLKHSDVIVFDGACVLCSRFVRFVVRYDTQARYRLLTAQSPLGEALYAETGLKHGDYDTVIVLKDGKVFEKLDATMEVLRDLGWPWRALTVASWLPLRAKSWLYDGVAHNRFRLFGRLDTCRPPDPAIKMRLLDQEQT